MKPICPNCQSSDVTYRSKKQCYICDDCNHEFVSESPFQPLRIFISYGHDEYASFAQKLKDDLMARGHEVWFDIERLKPGGDWEQYIEEGLDWVAEIPGTGRMILIMTPHSVRRPDGFCLNEISRALDHHLFIVPVMLVWCNPPLTISRIQWLDMQHCSKLPVPAGSYDTSKNRLIEALEHERLDFEGQSSLLYANLQPLSFEADIIHYQKWFTGRKWVFDKIDHWLKEESGPRLFWITGLPGIGKTAIATQLRERMPNMVAFHLCRRGNSEKSSPRRTVMSVAHQLSTQLPDYAERLAILNLRQLISNPDVNAAALFDLLIVQPLARDIRRPQSPQVILIDGLDEASQDGRNILAEFIASEFHKLPDWLRLIITSRPDPEVTHPLQSWDRWTLEAESPENRKDMEEYIRKMLDGLSNAVISDEVIHAIINNSEGIFLYAEWVCREILDGKLSPDKPEEFPKGLGEVYASFFRNKLTTEKNYKNDIRDYHENIRPVLELIQAAREPLPVEQITQWMQWTTYDKNVFLKKFGSLFFQDANGCLRPFHTSVLDWLGDHHKAGDFHVDKKMGNKRLSELLWNEYQQNGALNISHYGLKHLPVHLLVETMWDNLTDLLCNLDFVQAKAAAKMTWELVEDLNAAMQVIPENQKHIREEQQQQARMEKYTRDLIACARGEISGEELEVPESVKPWTKKQISAEVERMKTNPNLADRLKSFQHFLGQEANNLQSYASEFNHFSWQQAWNFTDTGPVGDAAGKLTPEAGKTLLRRIPPTRPPWDPIPQMRQTLRGHTSSVRAVFMTPDGKKAISGSEDKTCILWDLTTGEALQTLKGHTDFVSAVSISPDGERAISGSYDKNCILWDLTTREALQTLKGHTSYVKAVSIRPDGTMAISGSYDNTCILWDLTMGVAIQTLKGHTSFVSAVSIIPDGKMAISGSNDNTCILWDLTTGEALQTLKGHTSCVLSVSIIPDGKIAISGSNDNTCILWDLTTGEAIQTIKGHTSYGLAVCISPDGKRAISGSEDKTCILWDLTSGDVLQNLQGHTSSVRAVSISSDGKRAISGSYDKTCILWDLTTRGALQTTKEHNSFGLVASISPDGKRAISGSSDMTCILWDLATGEALQTLKGHTSSIRAVSISLDGKMAISGSSDKTCILWNLTTGETLQTLKGHTAFISAISISPDWKRVISASSDKTCIIWNLTTGGVLQTLKGHTSSVSAVSITPDGKTAISGSKDKTCILWNLTTGEAKQTLMEHTSSVNAVSITPDGKIAISASNDNTCILWNLTTGESLQTLNGHTSSVLAVSISPDGKRAITSSSDKTSILWNLTTGEAKQTLKGHTDMVNVVSITLDGKRAISGSVDKTCFFWDLDRIKKLALLTTNSSIRVALFFPNGVFIGCDSGELIILKPDKNLLCPGRGIITIRRIWDFEFRQYQPLSADCPLCGHRFSPPGSVLQTIEKITRKAGLRPEQSPCLELPDEIWEDPGLLSNCPKCGEKLKFNPFIA